MKMRMRRLLLQSFLIITLIISFGAIAIAARLSISIYQNPKPQLIFVLGGDPAREIAAAQIAKQTSELETLVSSRRPARIIYRRFEQAGVSLERVTIDARASNTVTNFTTTVDLLNEKGIKNVYLVTSVGHMRRSQAIAFWIFGSRGIWCTPVNVSSELSSEPIWKIPRDIIRCWLWLVTGFPA